MNRPEIEASVARLIAAYEASGKAKTLEEREAADAEGRAAMTGVAVDTVHVLHRIADAQERIAVAIEKMAGTPDLFG